MIKLKNISKTYTQDQGQNVKAIQNLSLEIRENEVFGIIGLSGAGKSTLVRCINLLERPEQGEVIVKGKNLLQLKPKELRQERRKIGMIFQHFNLMQQRTISGNIAFPLENSQLSKSEIKAKVDYLLELVDLSDKAKSYPSELSGGQKQRAGIARALANDPDILLCDEATSALDPKTTTAILELLLQLKEKLNITLVVITHEMSVIKEICDRLAVMDEGQIVELGSTYEVFAKPKAQITKELISASSNLDKINKLIAQKSKVVDLAKNEIIIKLTYQDKSATKAIVSKLSRKYNLNFNIILANMEIILDNPLGGLVCILEGDQIDPALKDLRQDGVDVRILLDGRKGE